MSVFREFGDERGCGVRGCAGRASRLLALKAVHWGLLLVIAAYMAVRMSHAAASREQSEVLVQLHRSIGVTVFAVTLFRVAWRWNSRIPPLPGELPLFQKIGARATEYALYFLMPCCLPAAPEPLHGIRAPFSDVGTRSALARQDEAS